MKLIDILQVKTFDLNASKHLGSIEPKGNFINMLEVAYFPIAQCLATDTAN